MLCITVAKDDKWANVIAAKVIGVSKHIDYALFHWKAKDVKALKLPLSKFIFVSAAGVVDEVILADQLAARGSNFKTAKRDSHPLTEEEQWEVEAAIELVQGVDASARRAEQASNQERGPASTEPAPESDSAQTAAMGSDSEFGGASSAGEPESESTATLGTEQLGDLGSEAADEAVHDAHVAPAIKQSHLANKKKRR